MEIFVITYETINRKDELREIILTEQGGVVTDSADTKIALHQKTYVTTIYGQLRRRNLHTEKDHIRQGFYNDHRKHGEWKDYLLCAPTSYIYTLKKHGN